MKVIVGIVAIKVGKEAHWSFYMEATDRRSDGWHHWQGR